MWKVLIEERINGHRYGVLQGPTYPSEFYAGPFIVDHRNGRPMPWLNDTEHFHRTVEAALDRLANRWLARAS